MATETDFALIYVGSLVVIFFIGFTLGRYL
jgi:hypothetical protein